MRLRAYLAPLIAWAASWSLIFGLPLAGLAEMAWMLPGEITLPPIVVELSVSLGSALDLPGWQVTAIPLPTPELVWRLALVWFELSLAFLALLLLLHALSPLRRLMRAHGPVARVPQSTPLYQGLAEVALACDQAMPSLWILDTTAINACALAAPGGRQAVLLTAALVQSVPQDELRWVFAHELAHLHYGDAAGTTLWRASQRWRLAAHRLRARVIGRVVTAARRTPLLWLVAPLLILFFWLFLTLANVLERIALIVLDVISRAGHRRAEYRADAYAANLLGPKPGITLLARLDSGNAPVLADLMGTHPSASSRIRQLQTAASTAQHAN